MAKSRPCSSGQNSIENSSWTSWPRTCRTNVIQYLFPLSSRVANGQHLELIFLSDGRIDHDKLREELVKAGVTGKKWDGYLKGGGYGQMTWTYSVKPLDLVVANYEGIWNKHFVVAGFD